MARYIDADKVLDKMMFEMAGTGHQARAMAVIRYAETADVVPKSEVVAMMQWVELLKTQLAEAKQEVAREIFEEIEEYASIVLDEYGFHGFFKMPYDDFAELKKKYTESEGKECL